MKKISKKILQIMKKRDFWYLLAILVLVILVINFSPSKTNITTLEKKYVETYSNDIINYIDVTAEEQNIDTYIVMAVKYYFNELNKEEISVKEAQEYINTTYGKSFKEEEFTNNGITPYLLDNHVILDVETNNYTYKNNLTVQDIAQKEIYKYLVTDVKKDGDNKFVVEYQKYIISEPYEVLNYYEEQKNIEVETPSDMENAEIPVEPSEADMEKIEKLNEKTTKILNYLNGKAPESSITDSIDNEDVSKLGKADIKFSITYELKDNNLILVSINK